MLRCFTEWKPSSIDERQAVLSGLAREAGRLKNISKAMEGH